MGKRGPQPTYPWARWLERKRLRLIQGRDYHCQPHGMASQIRAYARRNGLRSHICIYEGYITVEWYRSGGRR